jgi:hypothetical protein
MSAMACIGFEVFESPSRVLEAHPHLLRDALDQALSLAIPGHNLWISYPVQQSANHYSCSKFKTA